MQTFLVKVCRTSEASTKQNTDHPGRASYRQEVRRKGNALYEVRTNLIIDRLDEGSVPPAIRNGIDSDVSYLGL